ncbi:DNA-directed RNA polymerase IV subunit 1 [Citrus sinensis]|uniref:DNA-directed RNA polymerase IV subunit 1 n=1 Tax=Citrus sinensis TaxID=2711 RepID=A0ACB8LWA2_CITSI|nr:DNA-directed RNA polymerase IV subunit 1 [Citrus sinensis]
MDNEFCEEGLEVPSGILTGISLGISTDTEKEKLSVMEIGAVSEVTNPRLGLPNPTNECSSCGAKDRKACEGHFGFIKFPFTILHPYFLSDIAKLLNSICPKCKTIRKERQKGAGSSRKEQPRVCKYCVRNPAQWYPRMRFKLSSKDLSGKTAIIVEIDEKPSKKNKKLPDDYWGFIPFDAQQEENSVKPNRKVSYLLKDVDPSIREEFILSKDAPFLKCFPVTPNNHRVTEVPHAFSHEKKLFFLHLDKSSRKDSAEVRQKKNIDISNSSGLRWIKDVVLGKRNDDCFRMVVTGDPNIKLKEIGIPCHVAERLQISERLNSWNWERLSVCTSFRLLEKGELYVCRKGGLVRIRRIDALELGDIIYRPLTDGDIVLINRPPSIHPHSLIALTVKVLPISSVVTINPLCCSPFHGDFDGDCLHGYIPQAIGARVELTELVALDKQLINQQSGRNLLSLGQDSLTAAHLLMEDSVLLSHLQMQQLQMFCPHRFLSPDIFKISKDSVWSGKQLFSMLLPPDFEYTFPSKDVYISGGKLISAEGSSWLRDYEGNLFQYLIKRYQDKVLDFLYAAQEVLCEWLSVRGMTVSLSDLYLASHSCSRKILMDEIFYGLREAQDTCNFQQLMVDSHMNFLMSAEDSESTRSLQGEHLSYEKQRSAALSQASVDAFKHVFWDIQNLAYKYGSKDNSLLAMFKAGSKGNLLKLVQHSLCLGLQHSLAPLSFRFPHELSCAAWNRLRAGDNTECAKSYIPSAVVANSFLTGLNPLECFIHSVTSRDSSFSDNADLPGTLTRRLMFFMRDLCTAYDGTVRNAYGNQIVQFSYNIEGTSTPTGEIGGQSVGSLSACAISEAAYSALDQPISLLETSPLLNLKEIMKRTGLKEHSIIDSLYRQCKAARTELKISVPDMLISNKDCSSINMQKECNDAFCVTVMIVENFKRTSIDLETIQMWVMPFLLKTVVKGFREIKKVDILWKDKQKASKSHDDSFGELYLRVSMSGQCHITSLWSALMNDCHQIMDMIDWTRSHPDNIRSFCLAYGIDAGLQFFLTNLESAISDTGKNILPEHLLIVANTLSATGEFVGLNAKGLALQRKHSSVSSPFVQAFFSVSSSALFPTLKNFENPGASFIKAAKAGAVDNLQGSVDALGWGKVPSVGTGGHFDIIYSGEGRTLSKPVDVYNLLSTPVSSKQNEKLKVCKAQGLISDKCGAKFGDFAFKGLGNLDFETISRGVLRKSWTYNDVLRLSNALKKILHKYSIGQRLSEKDKTTVIRALYFHPRRNEKLGIEPPDIEVTYHPEHQNSRCFSLVREDGSIEDFSYHKCVIGALEIIAPEKAEIYRAKWKRLGTA